jgi:hypothetical protein
LIVSFNTQDLRDCCASLERAEAVFGSAHAQELMTVLSDAEAVDPAAELMELYAPDVAVDGNSLSLPIGVNYRLSFIAIGATIVRDREIGLDWGTVWRLKMMDISPC